MKPNRIIVLGLFVVVIVFKFIRRNSLKYRIAMVVCIFAVTLSSVAGQTASELEAKYGQRENVYSVSDHLWMTPTYGADQRVCMMRLYPKLVSPDANYLDAKLDQDEVLKFIDRLVPVDSRGARKAMFGMSNGGGGVIWTNFTYERVRFVFISTFKLDRLPEPLGEHVDLDFPVEDAAMAEFRREEASQTDDALMRKYAPAPRLVEVYWPDRKCAERKGAIQRASGADSRQSSKERNDLMKEAERNTFTVRRVEFIGLTYTRDQDVRDHMTPFVQEGDIFSREKLVKSLESMSRLRTIDRLRLRDVVIQLERSDKTVDMIICFKQKPRSKKSASPGAAR